MKKTLMCIFIIAIGIYVTSCSPVSKVNKTATDIPTDDKIVESSEDEHEVYIDQAQKRKVNIFLSNFAECFIDNLNVNETDEEQLIRFAVSHNYKNNYNLWLPGDSSTTAKIDAKFIEKTIKKYFNKEITEHKSIGNDISFKDGYYFVQEAAGESIPFVQVNKLVQGVNGSLIAYGDVCGDANNLSKDDQYEPLENWTDEEKKEIELSYKVKAEFKEVEDNGQKRYVLIEYSLVH